MLHPTLTLHLIIFSGLPLLFNLISVFLVLNQKKGRTIKDNPSLFPLLCLLLTGIGLSLLLGIPIYNFMTESTLFTKSSCQVYGAADMSLSLLLFMLTCLIAFDRYISTISPKWGKWRCNLNYLKVLCFCIISVVIWSLVPLLGYGHYELFLDGQFCSLDWTQGDISHISKENSQEGTEIAHRYIAFLTATCLTFFLIPVCIASALYYSIIDHVDRINSTDSREENNNAQGSCPWAPKGHVAKIGLGGLLTSTLPYLGYAVVCLNPMKSDFTIPSYVVLPVIISRMSPLLIPLFYIWLNPEVLPIDVWIEKSMAKRRPPPKTYHTINLMMNVPGVTFPILTPTMPRRQLPQIPPHLVSPSRRPANSIFYDESRPMLR